MLCLAPPPTTCSARAPPRSRQAQERSRAGERGNEERGREGGVGGGEDRGGRAWIGGGDRAGGDVSEREGEAGKEDGGEAGAEAEAAGYSMFKSPESAAARDREARLSSRSPIPHQSSLYVPRPPPPLPPRSHPISMLQLSSTYPYNVPSSSCDEDSPALAERARPPFLGTRDSLRTHGQHHFRLRPCLIQLSYSHPAGSTRHRTAPVLIGPALQVTRKLRTRVRVRTLAATIRPQSLDVAYAFWRACPPAQVRARVRSTYLQGRDRAQWPLSVDGIRMAADDSTTVPAAGHSLYRNSNSSPSVCKRAPSTGAADTPRVTLSETRVRAPFQTRRTTATSASNAGNCCCCCHNSLLAAQDKCRTGRTHAHQTVGPTSTLLHTRRLAGSPTAATRAHKAAHAVPDHGPLPVPGSWPSPAHTQTHRIFAPRDPRESAGVG
ncbi:hypothetical protein GY45DRAFT_774934 [Cubamyces sp. BRFM 1775]|nr:hypothetical protein GY45DRAFT_774934 [Cubamyces sp. BRFM 1775]